MSNAGVMQSSEFCFMPLTCCCRCCCGGGGNGGGGVCVVVLLLQLIHGWSGLILPACLCDHMYRVFFFEGICIAVSAVLSS